VADLFRLPERVLGALERSGRSLAVRKLGDARAER
jgi:hypothetical protein